MNTALYKAQAKRLAKHLADKHGVRLKHASVLEAISALHGAKDWNTLTSKQSSFWRALLPSKPEPLGLVQSLSDLQFETPLDVMRLGVDKAKTHEVALSYSKLRKHLLLSGPTGSGAHSALEMLAAQHVLKGGGLVWLCESPLSMGCNQKLLLKAAEQVGRAGPRELANVPLHELPDHQALKEGIFCLSSRRDASPSDEPATSGQALLKHLVTTFLTQDTDTASAIPLLVVVQNVQLYGSLQWAAVMAQARALGLVLVIHAENLSDLQGVGNAFEQTIIANTGTKLIFKPSTQEEAHRQAEALARSSYAKPAGEIAQELSTLDLAEALLLGESEVRHMKLQVVDLEG